MSSDCRFCGQYLCGEHAEDAMKREFPAFLSPDVVRACAEAYIDVIYGPDERAIVRESGVGDMTDECRGPAIAALYAALKAMGEKGVAVIDARLIPKLGETEDEQFKRLWDARMERIWGRKPTR